MKHLILIVLLSCLCFSNDKNLNYNTAEKQTIKNIENEFEEFDEEEFEEFDEITKNTNNEIFDPLSGYNRVITSFNDKVYIHILNPIATTYSKVLPNNARVGIANFFNNLLFPINFVNNLLQLKFINASEELGRFIINTIWGLGGFMNPASEYLQLKEHKEDFGQTLGYWGIGEGFPLVLPFLGPSNLRDTLSLVGDSYINPLNSTGSGDLAYKISKNWTTSIGIKTFDIVNSTSLRLGQYENIKKDALDLYPFLRDIYSQMRKQQIKE